MSDMRFQEGLTRLESVVKALENNELELEDVLLYYEEGIKLYGQLVSKLENAEKRIEALSGQESEKLNWRSFRPADIEQKDRSD